MSNCNRCLEPIKPNDIYYEINSRKNIPQGDTATDKYITLDLDHYKVCSVCFHEVISFSSLHRDKSAP